MGGGRYTIFVKVTEDHCGRIYPYFNDAGKQGGHSSWVSSLVYSYPRGGLRDADGGFWALPASISGI